MKQNLLNQFVYFILILVVLNPLSVHSKSDKVKVEITEAMNLWNAACKNADLEKVMSMFDNSESVMVIGSANGEICKGKAEIRKWLGNLFAFAGFSWEMNQINIDHNDKTAWVFIEGTMVVNIHKGGTKKTPYRFTAVLVKKNNVWKWRLTVQCPNQNDMTWADNGKYPEAGNATWE